MLPLEVNKVVQSSLLAQSEFCSVGRAVQIVYNSSHWVAVAGADDDVLVANSVGDSVSATVIKQLKELFRTRTDADGQLRVGLVRCTQQSNSSDCGVFAAALCLSGRPTSCTRTSTGSSRYVECVNI